MHAEEGKRDRSAETDGKRGRPAVTRKKCEREIYRRIQKEKASVRARDRKGQT